MSNSCLNCKRWCGTKYSKWGRCQWVIGDLLSWVFKYTSVFGNKLTLPFDPHDVKYFPDLNDRLKIVAQKDCIDGWTRVHREKQDDIKFLFDPNTGDIVGERTTPRTLTFFYTHRDKKGCQYYE